jgi:hypothetical protein
MSVCHRHPLLHWVCGLLEVGLILPIPWYTVRREGVRISLPVGRYLVLGILWHNIVEVGGWYIPHRMGSGSCSGGTAIVPILFVVGRHATLVCRYGCLKTQVPLFWLGVSLSPPYPASSMVVGPRDYGGMNSHQWRCRGMILTWFLCFLMVCGS